MSSLVAVLAVAAAVALRGVPTPWPTWALVLLFGVAPLAAGLMASSSRRRELGLVLVGLGVVLAAVGVRTTISTDALLLVTMDFPVTQVLTGAATWLAPVALVAAGVVLALAGLAGWTGDRWLGGTATITAVVLGTVTSGALLGLALQPLGYRGGTVQQTPAWAALATGLATAWLLVVAARWWFVGGRPGRPADLAGRSRRPARRQVVRWGALAALVAVLAGAGLWSRARVSDRFDLAALFPDPSLAGCVASAMELTPGQQVSERELSGLTQLNCQGDLNAGGPITSLAGIDALPGLTGLEVPNNGISDLGPLAGTPQLRSLSVTGNRVSDLTPLAVLTSLTDLELFRNQVGDLTPLAGLTALDTLEVSANQVTDLTPLAGLTRLETLGLHSNGVVDVSPLAGLMSLRNVGLSQNQVVDPRPLCGLPALTHLDLTFDRVADAGTLAGCVALEQLNLGGNPLTDLTPLVQLPSLLGVDLSETDPSRLTGIADLQAKGVYVGGLAG